MKVLWITNILFPEVVKLLTGEGELRASGGWMLGAADALLEYCDDIQLTVAAPSRIVKKLTYLKGEKIEYYVLPSLPKEYVFYWKEVREKINPDIVHIHGTEYSHGLAYVKACGAENVVVSIQGLVSVYSRHYYDGMTMWDIIRNITIHDSVRGTIFAGKKNFFYRGESERELIRSVNHVIGRTVWDRAHVWAINSQATYHFCNETLRHDFYTGLWSYQKCVPHTIFISQASYPIKGLHQLLKALPLVLRHYPDTQVRIAGVNITEFSSLYARLRRSGYAKYISGLISQLHLENNITFLGPLNAKEMKDEYLRTNVFVCPSAIENSPNSLGEAQILGVPCIASYVGGAMDMMNAYESFLYRFEDIEMLAWKICKLFEESMSFDNTMIRNVAKRRHDPGKNVKQLLSIYQRVLAHNV